MARELQIDGTRIADDAPAYVIAEIGHNHSGNMDRAKEMVDSAKKFGASAVKFQTRIPEEVYSVAEYNKTSDNVHWMGDNYGQHREAIEPSKDEWIDLFAHCREVGITAFSTPFDFGSADLLQSLDVPAFKIASGDATNIPMIEYIAEFNKPMIISTGGSSIEDVDRIKNAMSKSGTPYALLQCSCIYPAPAEVLNLRVIDSYRNRYPEIVTGLSTHNPNIYSTVAAFTLGGRIFEHHYTNDRDWKGTDNNFSLTPKMLGSLVTGLAEVSEALGDGEKYRFPVEEGYTIERRKKLIWAADLPAGHTVTREDISIKCPGDGIQPYDIDKVIGTPLTQSVTVDEDIAPSDIGVELFVQAGA
jgi:sialic acid synthase